MTTTAPSSGIPVGLRKAAFDALPPADNPKGQAAGVLFVAPDGDILLLRRSGKEANFAGHWALPGGGVESGETPEQGAARECDEEIGAQPGKIKLIDRRITPNGFTFHTFASPVADKFVPRLNGEHSGFVWSPINQLPEPMHPAVRATLTERLGQATDMAPEEWEAVRTGLMKWIDEEQDESEHDDFGATDSAMKLALDRDSVREKDKDGRLRVAKANLTKEDVNPYYGHEIPGYQKLGLDPDRIYHLYRPGEEIEKAANTINGVQFLRQHTPVNAADHKPGEVIGTVGTTAKFEAPYLTNGLTVWSQDAIDDIESEQKKELSCGYHYRPEMTPGTFNGKAFDGVMRDIVFNHVALVEDGRAGDDVVVGDSMENLKMKNSAATIIARTATVGALFAAFKPKMAMDSGLKVASILKDVTPKNFASKKGVVLERIKNQFALAQDAEIAQLDKLLDALSGQEAKTGLDESVSEEQHNAMEAAAAGQSELGIPQNVGEEFAEADKGKTFDAEPVKAFLREKGVADEDIDTAMSMFPQPATAQDEDPDDKKKDGKEAVIGDEDEPKKDKDMKDVVTTQAMDAAIRSAVDNVRKTEREIRSAIDDVRPHVGDLPAGMAFDSGASVYRKALTMLGVDTKGVHDSALKTILSLTPLPGARDRKAPALAMDAATANDLSEAFPGIDRIGVA